MVLSKNRLFRMPLAREDFKIISKEIPSPSLLPSSRRNHLSIVKIKIQTIEEGRWFEGSKVRRFEGQNLSRGDRGRGGTAFPCGTSIYLQQPQVGKRKVLSTPNVASLLLKNSAERKSTGGPLRTSLVREEGGRAQWRREKNLLRP